MIGNFKNSGAKWDRSPILVNDPDFLSDASGVGISYGILRPTPQPGHRLCWRLSRYTGLRRSFHRHLVETGGITVLWPYAQTTGSGRFCTSWAWKVELQSQVCNPFGLAVTIAHYPTGASKHSLFSEISKNWAAEPLDSYEKMRKYIRSTDPQTGLVVTAYLDRNVYPTRLKPEPQLISSLRLTHGKVLPRWNYTIRPNL
jgi:hypothetical protein